MKLPRTLLFAAMLAGTGGLAAHASPVDASSASADVVHATVDGHAFQNGGYGKEQVRSMERSKAPYNLHLTFSEGKHNAYLAELKLKIEDQAGHQVFAYGDAGPLTDVELPAGQYRVLADYNGVERGGTVAIKPGGDADLNLHWPSSAS